MRRTFSQIELILLEVWAVIGGLLGGYFVLVKALGWRLW